MDKNPIQCLNIAPEALEIANCYLETSDAKVVAQRLNIPTELVTEYLGKKEVSDYINHVFSKWVGTIGLNPKINGQTN